MRRKREGASLIYVIITFMFVCMVSSAMLSMVSANYRSRTIESKRIENLYGADSGIEVGYNILGKTFDSATQYGYYCVKQLNEKTNESNSTFKDKYNLVKDDINKLQTDIDDLNKEISYELKKESPNKATINLKKKSILNKKEGIQEDNDILNDILNEEFKMSFSNFIKKTSNVGNGNYINNKLEILFQEHPKYVIQVNGINSIKEAEVKYQSIFKPNLKKSQVIENIIEKDREIKYEHQNTVSMKIYTYRYDINIKSSFKDTSNSTIGDNLRTLEANFSINVPNYDDVFFSNGKTNNFKYLALQDRGLTIGGDMIVNNVNSLEINGDIFVNGSEPTVNNHRTFQKYNGGIQLNQLGGGINGNVNFNGDVISRESFNIQNNVGTQERPVNIIGDLYASNVYAGNPRLDAKTEKSYLKFKNVVLDNDLALKANSTEIEIENFYGINDKTVKLEKTGEPVKSSSSIIVNGNENSEIKVNDSAYIMGVAYIDTLGEGYKTGESVAIKGNYIAYSIPSNPIDTSESFEYYSPLHLLDTEDVNKKSQHFYNYWNGKANVNTGGISLPENNTWSVGAIVYKDKNNNPVVKNDNSKKIGYEEQVNIINPKRIEFAKKVYKFGEDATIDDYNNVNKVDIEDLVDLSSISCYIANGENEKAIFVNDDKSKIQIKSNKIILDDKDDNTTEFKFNSSTGINAVIVTNGDVIINDDVIFNGTIICNGNLEVNNNNNAIINYNPEVISRIQNSNEDLFKSVFGRYIINIGSTDLITQGGNQILDTNYDINKFLKKGIWQINK